MEKILIVEDELIVARDIRKTLERNGYKTAGVARTAEKALDLIRESRPSLVLVDIFLKGDLTGIDLAAHLNAEGIPFIYVSANSNQPVLEAAKMTNPYGFIVKPFREKDLLVTIDIARYRYENSRRMGVPPLSDTRHAPGIADAEISRTAPVLPPVLLQRPLSHFDHIIGKSAPMLKIFNLIQQVAPFETSVLLLGESGTGKEGIADCIFRHSNRSNKPFIKINCAAFPAELIESELFGYEKGAFTGAADRRVGKFELANGGTILLDEIGEVPIDMQAKLLRVLQEKEVQRIGGSTTTRIDVRIIAATSRILEKEVAEGRFRLDLYYRLHVFPISLPPLRQRKEDIPLLVDHFIRYYAGRTGKKISGIDPGVLRTLVSYDWPGNVRELQYLVERSVLLATDDTIREMALPENRPEKPLPAVTGSEEEESVPATMTEENEKERILAVLKQCNYRIKGKQGAAELLNMTPSLLHNKMKKLGISKTYFY